MKPRPPANPSPSHPSRRRVLAQGLSAALALPFAGRFAIGGLPLPVRPVRDPRAASIIHLHLAGGLSHLDSFDPKPYAPLEIRGDYDVIPTAVTGEVFAEPLAQTAKIADQLAVLRGVTHGETAHERASHYVLTGYSPLPALSYPSLGAITAHELGGRQNLPAYIAIPSAQDEALGTGYLGSAFAPFNVGGEPNSGGFRVRDLEPPGGLDAARAQRRRSLLTDLDARFAAARGSDAAAASDAFLEQAYALIESPAARAAFDIKAEPAPVRDRYGRTPIGQRLLLARRLVAGGARYVVVTDSGYDHHAEVFRNLRRKLAPLDQGFATLITELRELGLLERTLVLVTTEFGRTPVVNRDRGRDHAPRVFSCVLAGGGVRGGAFHGTSNAQGQEPDRDPVTPNDLAATVFTLLGIDPTKKLLSPGDRPVDLVRDGRVLSSILG